MIKIKDNFLKQEEFDKIQKLMMGPNFPWFYTDRILFDDNDDDEDEFQFFHIFYNHGTIEKSSLMNELSALLNIIKPFPLLRIKTNLLTRTPNIVENKFHVDIFNISKEKLKQWTTSIFYVNTNNGYTKFEDGTKVKSVANRLVTFPANMKHYGTSCTNENTRVVINFNYFKNT